MIDDALSFQQEFLVILTNYLPTGFYFILYSYYKVIYSNAEDNLRDLTLYFIKPTHNWWRSTSRHNAASKATIMSWYDVKEWQIIQQSLRIVEK